MTPELAGRGRTVLVTGASSGIGAALAQRFAHAGFNLVLVARSQDKLAQLARALAMQHGIRAWVAPADLSQGDAALQLAVQMTRAHRRIDVLVNCAGVMAHGSFIDMPAARHRELIDLNVSGLTDMLSAFVPGMVGRGSGRVLNVASISAFQPVPMLATYAATKAYVLSLTESLAEELRGTGVSVTALCPGITDTPMLSQAEQSNPALGRLPGLVVGGVDAVADAGFTACMAGQVICVPGAVNQAAVLAGRATPKWLLRRVSGALARRLKR